MNLTTDTTNKTIIVNETVNVKELLDYLKDNVQEWWEYSIIHTISWTPTYPVWPSYPQYPLAPSYNPYQVTCKTDI